MATFSLLAQMTGTTLHTVSRILSRSSGEKGIGVSVQK
jgi:hypothetical protein